MVVCKFYQNGNCRNGANCKFEHKLESNSNNNNNGNNRNNHDNRQSSFGAGGLFGNASRPERWNLNEQDIRNDLSVTRPNWILSAYGPGKEPPASLFVDNEFSPEELRCRFYAHQESGPGQADQADQEAIRLWSKAANDMTEAAGKVSDIQKYMLEKERDHPNRYDFCRVDGKLSREEVAKKAQMNSLPNSALNPWGAANSTAATTSNPFSKPAFGQSAFQVGSSQPSTTFGQSAPTSAFGKPAQSSAFGKPGFGSPAFGQQTNTGFGASSSNSAFGKPSIPGSGFGQTGFGQTTPNTTSSLGQQVQSTSGFGQTSNLGHNNPNPFARPTAASGFGAAGAATTSAFGQPSFGQTSGPGFGASNAQQALPFGQPSFGKPAITGSSPFGQAAPTSSFGQTGFGAQSTPTPPQPAFGATAFSGFGAQRQPTGFGQSPQQLDDAPQQGFGAGFGQNATNQQQNSMQSGFGTGFGQNTNISSTGSPFGAQPPANAFSASPFGQTGNQQSSPFIQAPTSQATSNPFSQPQPSQVTSTDTNLPQQPLGPTTVEVVSSKPTLNPVRPLLYTQTLPSGPTTFAPRGELTQFRSCAVDYRRVEEPTMEGEMRLKELLPRYRRPDNRQFERIWFPKGNAEASVQALPRALLDVQLADDAYTDEIKAKYAHLFETGMFENGKIPLVPPMQAWIDRDF